MLEVRRRFTTVPKPKAIIQIPYDATTNTAQRDGQQAVSSATLEEEPEDDPGTGYDRENCEQGTIALPHTEQCPLID